MNVRPESVIADDDAPPRGDLSRVGEAWAPLRELLRALDEAPGSRECLESARRLELLASVRSSLDDVERDLQREHFACCVVPHVQPVEALAMSLRRLAERRVGALIAVEQGDSLDDYIARGTLVDARLTADLVDSLFHPGSRLHDGAVIVRGDRIVSAGVFFPVTGERREPDHGRLLGSRHRAALGLGRLTAGVRRVRGSRSDLARAARPPAADRRSRRHARYPAGAAGAPKGMVARLAGG